VSIDCRDFDGDSLGRPDLAFLRLGLWRCQSFVPANSPARKSYRLKMLKRVSGCNSSFVSLSFGLRMCRIEKSNEQHFCFLKAFFLHPNTQSFGTWRKRSSPVELI
jgi:hypothetical protein